jgi:hypothetical protein
MRSLFALVVLIALAACSDVTAPTPTPTLEPARDTLPTVCKSADGVNPGPYCRSRRLLPR